MEDPDFWSKMVGLRLKKNPVSNHQGRKYVLLPPAHPPTHLFAVGGGRRREASSPVFSTHPNHPPTHPPTYSGAKEARRDTPTNSSAA